MAIIHSASYRSNKCFQKHVRSTTILQQHSPATLQIKHGDQGHLQVHRLPPGILEHRLFLALPATCKQRHGNLNNMLSGRWTDWISSWSGLSPRPWLSHESLRWQTTRERWIKRTRRNLRFLLDLLEYLGDRQVL